MVSSALGPLISSWRKRDAHSERYLKVRADEVALDIFHSMLFHYEFFSRGVVRLLKCSPNKPILVGSSAPNSREVAEAKQRMLPPPLRLGLTVLLIVSLQVGFSFSRFIKQLFVGPCIN